MKSLLYAHIFPKMQGLTAKAIFSVWNRLHIRFMLETAESAKNAH